MKGGGEDGFSEAFGGDWLGEHAPKPLPLPAAQDLFDERPARVRAPGRCLCCPRCQSLEVHRRNNGVSESSQRWECALCRQSWKEPAALTVVRCYVVAADTR